MVVVGGVNHDRIWRIDGALAPNARLSFTGPEVRLGGGGFTSGSMLRQLGHDVVLVASLMQDSHGRAALDTLRRLGFDTEHVALLPGETPMVEILVDPSGERTILHRARPAGNIPSPRLLRRDSDAAYINAWALDPELMADLEALPIVMTQYPLRPVATRPANILIGSVADFAGQDAASLWERGRTVATERLSSLVLTDGPRPIQLIDREGTRAVPTARKLELADTTGAGDYFAAAYLHGLLEGLGPADAAFQASGITAQKLIAR
ncbi:MAG: PfkB family carbohydrate kinase [Devosia sp.]|nr:PfkB family carbohydrate kinase [Devosia sp.]